MLPADNGRNDALAQALMRQPTAQLMQLQQTQNGPMGGMFGFYQQYQPLRTALQQALQSRTQTSTPANPDVAQGAPGSLPSSF